MVTFLLEMLELPNFGHMTTCAIWFESFDKIWWRHEHKLWRYNFYFKMPLLEEDPE